MPITAISSLDLEIAVVARWASEGLNAGIDGRSPDTADGDAVSLWKIEAPEDIDPRNYVVFQVSNFAVETRSSHPTENDRINSIHRASLRFNCYANDDASAGAFAKLVMDAFDNANFALTTVPAGLASVILCQRIDDFADKVGENEWTHTVMYEVVVDSQQQKV